MPFLSYAVNVKDFGCMQYTTTTLGLQMSVSVCVDLGVASLGRGTFEWSGIHFMESKGHAHDKSCVVNYYK
jgi:hypothetical protein